jgi:hypothetical protein
MLHLIRTSIVHDLKLDGTVILDEVYLGADWGKKPSYQKFKKAKSFGFDIPKNHKTTSPTSNTGKILSL